MQSSVGEFRGGEILGKGSKKALDFPRSKGERRETEER